MVTIYRAPRFSRQFLVSGWALANARQIVTDLPMPDITGVQLTREIRRKYAARQMPVIMVTTQNGSRNNEEVCAAGVNAILHKPFNG